MKKVIKLTEVDLKKIITKILKEDDYNLEDYVDADEYAGELIDEIYDIINYNLLSVLESIDLGNIIKESQYRFKKRYPEYASSHESVVNESITTLMELSQNPDLENIVSSMMDGLVNGDGLY